MEYGGELILVIIKISRMMKDCIKVRFHDVDNSWLIKKKMVEREEGVLLFCQKNW